MFGSLVIGTISYDELDNGMPYIMCLPIKRSDYVKEKFLMTFMMIFGGYILGIIASVIIMIIGEELDILLLLEYNSCAISLCAGSNTDTSQNQVWSREIQINQYIDNDDTDDRFINAVCVNWWCRYPVMDDDSHWCSSNYCVDMRTI